MSWLDGISEEEWVNYDDGHAGGLPHRHETVDEAVAKAVYRPDSFVRMYNEQAEASHARGELLGDYAPLQRRTTDYRGITEELLRMLEYKQADYGAEHDPLANIKSSEKWGIPPWVAALIRAGDKMARLQAAARGQQLQNEPAEDSIMDAANYLIIALKLFREEQLAESEVDVSFRPDFGDRPV